jgi:excisionase family DNA binding protein
MEDQEKLLRADQVARRLGVTAQHVRWLVRQGKLEGERLSERNLRIPASALDAYRQNLEGES